MFRVRVPKPVLTVVAAFFVALVVGTVLLMLPLSTVAPGGISLVPALFTATSALSVTGLVVLDTGSDFTFFGQVVILALIQIGGLGVMLFTLLLGILVARRAGLVARQVVAVETGQSDAFGDLRAVVRRILVFTFVTEAVVALVLTLRFAWGGVCRSVGAPRGPRRRPVRLERAAACHGARLRGSGSSTPCPRSTTPGSGCCRTA